MFWHYWNWTTRILSLAGVGLIAAILFPVFVRRREPHRDICQSNLKQLALGIMQYTQDYDDKLPRVAMECSAYGWASAIFPYVKSTQVYQCPQDPTVGQQTLAPRRSGYTDYPFNKRFSGKPLSQIRHLQEQVFTLDGNIEGDVTDARYSFSQIPPKWRQKQNSPLYRHKGKANYLYADGHVKALLPGQVEDANQPRAVF